jgi:hypothetical protein
MSNELNSNAIQEIGRLLSDDSDWAGKLARLLHRFPPDKTNFGEFTVLRWAAGVEPIAEWARGPIQDLLSTRAILLRQQAARCDHVRDELWPDINSP